MNKLVFVDGHEEEVLFYKLYPSGKMYFETKDAEYLYVDMSDIKWFKCNKYGKWVQIPSIQKVILSDLESEKEIEK